MSYKRVTNKDWNKAKFECIDEKKKRVNLKRLWELENQIENGTLIELPCKVGDTVYFVNHYRTTPRIEEYKVYGFSFGKDGTMLHIDFGTYISVNEVCLTKAEAEEKLKELKGEV
jgi:hypothetical protein